MGIFWNQETRNAVFEEMMKIAANITFRVKNGKPVFCDSTNINHVFGIAQTNANVKNNRKSLSTKELEEYLPEFCAKYYYQHKTAADWVIKFLGQQIAAPVVQNQQTDIDNAQIVNQMNDTILHIGQRIAELGNEVTKLSEQLDQLRSVITNATTSANDHLKLSEPVKIKHIVLFEHGISETQKGSTKWIAVNTPRDVALIAAEYPDIERVTIALMYTSAATQAAIQNTFGKNQNIQIVRFIGSRQRVTNL